MALVTPHLKLVELFRQLTSPFPPEATATQAHLPQPTTPVRALLFDVYGTLISSGVGDISLDQSADQSELIHRLITEAGFLGDAAWDRSDLATDFNQAITNDHTKTKATGHPYPEVDILEIWHTLIRQWNLRHPGPENIKALVEQLAVRYECAVNPVWPNEGFRDILNHAQAAGLPMGIVSNAQFYTPLMLEAFLDKPLAQAGFHPTLQVWSYQERRGKPDTALYDKIASVLAVQFDIHPSEVLFVGNDMLKDIWAASQAGFKGVLYAGDARSLRERSDDDRCRSLKPYATITSLTQIKELLK